jgi:Fe-Mn family superoxide dismutase
MTYYELPELPYAKNALEPVMSETVLTLHHDVHHKGYVDNANSALKKLEEARANGTDTDMKSLLKGLSFNVGGHVLHDLFWKNMAPPGEGGEPEGKLKEVLEAEFGSIERFKQEFTQAAASTEGSGWGALAYCKRLGRPLLVQIEKHNVNLYPGFKLLLVVDVWEHAYYLDYKNKRNDFLDAFWKIVNFKEVGERLEKFLKCPAN